MSELQIFTWPDGKLYRAYAEKPPEVITRADGKFYRVENTVDVAVCEDCWTPIPRYVDFPRGLVSPESDGDHGGNFAKRRPAMVEGKEAIEAVQKVVCLGCYYQAFARMYPDATCPVFSDLVR